MMEIAPTLWDGKNGEAYATVNISSTTNIQNNQTLINEIYATWANFVSGTFSSNWNYPHDEDNSINREWIPNHNGSIRPYDWEYDQYAMFLDYDQQGSGFNLSSQPFNQQTEQGLLTFTSTDMFAFWNPNDLSVTEKVWNCFVDGSWASALNYIDETHATLQWGFYANSTRPDNETEISATGNSSVNFTVATWSQLTKQDKDTTTTINFLYDTNQTNFTNTQRLFQQTWDDFRGGWMDPNSLERIDDHSGYFNWYAFNGTTEPQNFYDTADYAMLNKTYYGSGNYYQFQLDSHTSSCSVYYYSNDAFVGGQDDQSRALAMAIWFGFLAGEWQEPYYIWPSSGFGYANYTYFTNLTTPFNTAPPMDITVWAPDATFPNTPGSTNATVTFAANETFVPELTDDLWDLFLYGTWNSSIQYFDNGTAALRYWNFEEMPDVVYKSYIPDWEIAYTRYKVDLSRTGTGVNNASVAVRYNKYSSYDDTLQSAKETWSNFTKGTWNSDYQIFNQYSAFAQWQYFNGSNAPWTFDANSRVWDDLPASFPVGATLTSDWDVVGNSGSTTNVYVGVNDAMSFDNTTDQAIIEKTFNDFLYDGAFSEPWVIYPSNGSIVLNYTYNMSLEWNPEQLVLDFNVTASDAVASDLDNTADVTFSSADGTTNLQHNKVQMVVDSLWNQFLNGTWAGNLTFVDETAATRVWNFQEKNSTESTMTTLWNKFFT